MSITTQIRALIDELNELAKGRDDAWQIPRVEGELLYHIALSANAKTIVEVGTSYGFSGLWWGAAMQQTGGRLHTIDVSSKKVESSSETFRRAGLDGIITNYQGDAQQILPKIAGPIDLAFVDADKVSTRAYFDLIWPKLRAGGSLVIDNATTHRAELEDFVAHVRSLADASSVEIAVGNGIEWTIKLR